MHAWAQYGFVGGHVALDFINTIDDEGKTRERSAIPDWRTALEWAVAAGVLERPEAKALGRHADGRAADDELAALHGLRELAWNVLRAVAAGQPAEPHRVAALNDDIKWALARASLEQDAGGFRWAVNRTLGLALVRARLALALADLLSHGELEQLGECGRCTSLFLDHGRGVGRRWCRMNTCGNRAKAERFRRRSQAD